MGKIEVLKELERLLKHYHETGELLELEYDENHFDLGSVIMYWHLRELFAYKGVTDGVIVDYILMLERTLEKEKDIIDDLNYEEDEIVERQAQVSTML